jgi:ABC-2 type transport system permease protein
MNRTGFYPTFIAFKTLIYKEVLRFLRIWSQTLVPPAITMSLYFIIFGKFIGSQIQHIEGYSYIQYIVPGLIMMSIMTNAYANTSASFFLMRFNKSIEELLVSPMPNLVILLGFSISGMLRGVLVGMIVMGISLFFTHVPIHHPLIVISVAVLSAMIFSLGGFINGVYAKRFDDIGFIPTFVLTPLTYLGGVFYSIKQLPPFWQSASLLNPILDMVDLFRFGLLNITDLNIYLGFILIGVLFFTLFFWAWYLLEKGVGIKV